MDPGLGIVAVLAWAPTLVLYALLLIFAIKTSRSCKLESLPWLAVYVLGSVVLSWTWPLLMRQAIDNMAMAERVPFGWTVGAFAVLLDYSGAFLSNLARLSLGILILSDLLFLLSKSGVAVKGGLLNRILRVRDGSIIWGSAIVVLLLAKLAVILIPHWY